MGGDAKMVSKFKNFIQLIKKLLTKKDIKILPLKFSIDLRSEDKIIIKILSEIDNHKIKKSYPAFWNYGYKYKIGNTIYLVSKEDFETFLLIKSFHHSLLKEDEALLYLNPQFLKHIRKRSNIIETQKVKSIRICDTPLLRKAELFYDPAKGIKIKVGYSPPEKEEIIIIKDLKMTPDKKYAFIENAFYPIPVEEDPKIRKWLEIGEKTISIEEIPEFFLRDLVLLKTKFNAILSESINKIQIIEKKFVPKVRIGFSKDRWLKFDISYQVGEYEIPEELLKKDQKYIKIDDFKWIKIDEKTIDRVKKQLNKLGIQNPNKIEPMQFFKLEDFIEKIGGTKVVAKDFQKFLDNLSDFQLDNNFQLPSGIEKDLKGARISLRPYQRAGIHWLTWLVNHNLHGILADDMGLGKTIQTILTIRLAYEKTGSKNHTLIICPKSVVRHWYREIKRVYPKAHVYEYIGIDRDPLEFYSKDPTFFITTYDIVIRDVEILSNIPFLFCVLDEGTQIKNPETKRAKAVKILNAAHRIVLSGTPIENRPSELWSIFDFLMKGHLGSYQTFIRKFENPILLGSDIEAKRLSRKIKPFILRRLKEDVAKDLPEKIEMQYWCSLTDEQKRLYTQILELHANPIITKLLNREHVNYASILTVLTKLKQVCDHPALITNRKYPIKGRSEKFDLVIEKMDQILENEEKVVIFSHYLKTLDLLQECLDEKSIKYIRIDGSTKNRQELIDKLNKGKANVALLSLRASGHGITITSANHVIHIDRWWNPAVEDQATDRVHRIGQTKIVYVYKILTKGTLEETIDQLIEKKRRITNKVLSATTEEMRWTREELLEILKPIE